MATLTDPAVIREVLERHGFSFSKALGQNFLINPAVCPKMAELCGADKTCGVLEVGPGVGVLTKELAQRAKKVVSVELDDRLLPVLKETLQAFDNVTVVHGDILKVDLAALFQEHFAGMRVAVCANLPYYITSPVILRLLESGLPIDAVTVMVQKEVADRLCARPGTKAAGALTVMADYYAEAEKLFEVSRGSFFPAPQVDSAVIRLSVRPAPAGSPRETAAFFRLVKAAFSQKRKTLCNAVSSALQCSKGTVSEALAACGLSPSVRAEALTTAQFGDLLSALRQRGVTI